MKFSLSDKFAKFIFVKFVPQILKFLVSQVESFIPLKIKYKLNPNILCVKQLISTLVSVNLQLQKF